MNMVEATQIIQQYADTNGLTFSKAVIEISENLKTVSSDVYDAWTLWHTPAGDYWSYMSSKAFLERLAYDYKNLSLHPESKKYFDSLI
jgi:hypothetical protein